MSITNSGANGNPGLASWAILPTAKAACCQCVRLVAIMGAIVVLPLLADDLVVTGPMTITASDLTYENRNIRVETGGELTVRGPHVFAEVTLTDNGILDYARENPDDFLSATALALHDSARFLLGGGTRVQVTGAVILNGTSQLQVGSVGYGATVGGVWQGVGSQIEAASITVAQDAVISADHQGYGSAGAYNAGGSGPGAGGGGTGDKGGGGGGGYGGAGGSGRRSAGGVAYGDWSAPLELGSGGGSGWRGYGYCRAGGAVHLEVDALNLDGTISANGAHGGTDVGGGAGGSILVEANTLRGAGTFHSNGGNGSGSCGGGGGGRIALVCTDMTDYTGLAESTVNGGTGWQHGDRGTIYPAGGLTVDIEPAEAVAAGAKWSTDGALWRDNAQTVMLAPGDYSLQFVPLPGWHTPVSQDVVVSQSGFLVVPASYSPIIVRTFTYTAGTNGSVDGEGQVTQSVEDGMSGEPVVAIAHSPAGTYPIVPGGGAAANYDFHYLNGTLTILAGKRFHLWATPDSAAPTALQFGQAETASSDFDPDWDAVAAQNAVAWLDNPLVTDPEKRLLNKDFRMLAGLSRWRLVLAEDGGHSAVTLTWDVEAATDGYAMYLQEIRGESPIGFPTDMHAVDNLETVVGATFEIVCGEPQNLEIPLHRGWNCIGTSLFGMASLGQLAGQPAADGIRLPAWLWQTQPVGAYRRVWAGGSLKAGYGYWVYVRSPWPILVNFR